MNDFQVIALALVFMFPQLVSGNLDEKNKVDLDTIEIKIESLDSGGYGASPFDSGYGAPVQIPGQEGGPAGDQSAPPAGESGIQGLEPADPNQAIMDALRGDGGESPARGESASSPPQETPVDPNQAIMDALRREAEGQK